MNQTMILGLIGFAGYYLWSHGYLSAITGSLPGAGGGAPASPSGGGGGGGGATPSSPPGSPPPYIPPYGGGGTPSNPGPPMPGPGTESSVPIYTQMFALSGQSYSVAMTMIQWGVLLKQSLIQAGVWQPTPTWDPILNRIGPGWLWPASWGNYPSCGPGQLYPNCNDSLTLAAYMALIVPELQSHGVNANWGGSVYNGQFIPAGALSGLGWAV